MLDEGRALDESASPFIAELQWHPLDRFTTKFGGQWNWETNKIDVAMLGFEHRSSKGHRLGFEYRFRRDRLDQFDIRYFWPINERWKILSRINYSLEDSDLLEALAGVEYESCCWGLRIVGRRYLKNRNGDSRDAVFIEIHLKGLASFGRGGAPLFYNMP